jgi:hypothetical protein
VIWVPLAGDGFRNTVRHEGFHWYLHELIDDVPIWFDEGYAQWFGATERKFARTKVGVADDDAVYTLKQAGSELTPLAKLMTMDQPTFMAKPTLHYAQAWALVHMLRQGEGKRIDGYFAKLLAGAPAAEAYEEFFAGDIEALEHAYRTHVRSLVLDLK